MPVPGPGEQARKGRPSDAEALTTQCPYYIEIHAKKARMAGATEQELAETTLVAAALQWVSAGL
jgi:AhpD family alkylhydroperoxidase